MRRLLVALVLLCTLAPAASAQAADDPSPRIVINGPVTIDRDQTTDDVVVVDGDVLVRGKVDGDLIAIAGDVVIRGTVTGNVVTVAGQAVLGRRAQVGGDLLYGDDKPRVTAGAEVQGETKKFDSDFGEALGVAAFALWLAVAISMLLLGLILLLLAPRAGDAVARTAKARWGASIGVGIGAFILLPIITGIALVSVLGSPLGVILALLLIPLGAIGYCAAAFVVGRLIVKNARIPAFLVGLLILSLLALIPFAGALIGFLATVFGVGVLFMAMFRARAA